MRSWLSRCAIPGSSDPSRPRIRSFGAVAVFVGSGGILGAGALLWNDSFSSLGIVAGFSFLIWLFVPLGIQSWEGRGPREVPWGGGLLAVLVLGPLGLLPAMTNASVFSGLLSSVVLGAFTASGIGIVLFLRSAGWGWRSVQLSALLVGSAILLGPYGVDPLLDRLDESTRTRFIQGGLLLHPLGPGAEILGVDWLRGSTSYRLSSIGSLYFFRYPSWGAFLGLHLSIAAGGVFGAWLLRQRKRKSPSS